MGLYTYFTLIERRKWVIVLTLLSVLAVTLIGARLVRPVYAASSSVRVSEQHSAPVGFSDVTYAERLQNTYVQVVTTRPFLEKVIDKLGLRLTDEALADMIKAQSIPTSELIRITVTSEDPRQAAAIANELASLVMGLEQPTYTISIVEPATIPSKPTTPSIRLYLPLAALVGLIAGLGLAFLLERLDGRVRSLDKIAEDTGVPLLGWIPRFKHKDKNGSQENLLLAEDHGTPAAEAFRVLAARLLSAAPSSGESGRVRRRSAVLLVTSPEPRAGKSTLLVNLARAFAQEGKRVVAVGSDVRHPDLAPAFGTREGEHDGNALLRLDHLDGALKESGVPGVRLLTTAWLTGTNELPTSARMQRLLTTIGSASDVILLDSAPALASADAAAIAPLADGILLVAASDHTTVRNLALTREQLEAAGGTVLGIILNQSKLPSDGNYYSPPARVRTAAGTQNRAATVVPAEDAEDAEPSPNGVLSDSRKDLEKAG